MKSHTLYYMVSLLTCSHFRKQLKYVAKTIRDYCKQAHKDVDPFQETRNQNTEISPGKFCLNSIIFAQLGLTLLTGHSFIVHFIFQADVLFLPNVC